MEKEYSTFVIKDGQWKKVTANKEIAQVIPWEERRANMKGVCKNCHGQQQIDKFYTQFDALVTTYNEKFAKPANKLYNMAAKDGLIAGSTFHTDLDWIW